MQATPNPILSGAGPAERDQPQLAYDKKNGTAVFFGGKGFNENFQDTWTWDGHTWTQQHPATSPGPILQASMAYDDATGLVVLFGGCPIGCQQGTNETWTWNGSTWTLLHPAISPSPRVSADMVYDAAIGKIVLFGGEGSNMSPLNDTWTWDGTTWSKMYPTTSPSARLDASIAYDPATHSVVLFGGDDMGAPIPLLTDTWTWNGITWTKQHPATSPEVSSTSNGISYGTYPTMTTMVWDDATQQMLLTLAGSDNSGQQKIQLSWTWDGSTWTQLAVQQLPIHEMDLFYSTAQQTVYAFGASITASTFDDSLWQWKSQKWQPFGA
jgi:hypothetical protein